MYDIKQDNDENFRNYSQTVIKKKLKLATIYVYINDSWLLKKTHKIKNYIYFNNNVSVPSKIGKLV